MNEYNIKALHWEYEYIISQDLKKLIEKEGFTGCDFWPVINHETGKKLKNIYQMYITGRIPEMSDHTNIVNVPDVEQCSCGKKGYTIKGEIVYNKHSLKSISDFNKTKEWVGGGETTWQLLIVTSRVYNLFKKDYITGVRFEPVRVIK